MILRWRVRIWSDYHMVDRGSTCSLMKEEAGNGLCENGGKFYRFKILQCFSRSKRSVRRKRAATARTDRIWEYGVVPYEINSSFSGLFGFFFVQLRGRVSHRRAQGTVQKGDAPLGKLYVHLICGTVARGQELYRFYSGRLRVLIVSFWSIFL